MIKSNVYIAKFLKTWMMKITAIPLQQARIKDKKQLAIMKLNIA